MLNPNQPSLVGHLVSVQPDPKGYVQVPAKALERIENGDYKVEYAAGNTEIVSWRQVGACAPWLKALWFEMKAS